MRLGAVKPPAWSKPTLAGFHVQAAEALARVPKVAGQAYFITNAEPRPFWTFLGDFLEPLGYERPSRRLPWQLVFALAIIYEWIIWLLQPFRVQVALDILLAPKCLAPLLCTAVHAALTHYSLLLVLVLACVYEACVYAGHASCCGHSGCKPGPGVVGCFRQRRVFKMPGQLAEHRACLLRT